MDIIELTKDNFDDVIENNDIVVMDFWAEWCGPCKAFEKTFVDVAAEHPDVAFAKVNTAEEVDLAADFKVRSIPHVVILKKNVVIFSESGAMPKSAFGELIDKSKIIDIDEVLNQIEKDQ